MTARVLVVDDILANVRLLEAKLAAEYFEVVTAMNDADALEAVQRTRPDIVLLDVMMPGIDGIEVTKWLKEDDELRMIPVIAVTAFAMKGDEQKIREGGCEAYISKPISVVSFLQTIDSYLKTPQ